MLDKIFQYFRHGIHQGKIKVARNEKQNKKLFGFTYSKNMANFEVFLWSISSSTNPEIVRSVYITLKNFKEQIFSFQFVKVIRINDENCVIDNISKARTDNQHFSPIFVRPWSQKQGKETTWYGLFYIEFSNNILTDYCTVNIFGSKSGHF